MTDKAKSAELIMQLYDLRREEVMREARKWFFTFTPESVEDIRRVGMGEHSAYYRMVTTYWDMACSFVNHGAIDPDMFYDANGEHVLVYMKLQPFLEELRATVSPSYLKHLEKAVLAMPDAEARLTRMREVMRRFSQSEAAAEASIGKESSDSANA